MFALINLVQMLSLELTLPLARRLQSERGATAVEYGLMVALIAVVIIAAVIALGDQLVAVFENITTKITPAATSTA